MVRGRKSQEKEGKSEGRWSPQVVERVSCLLLGQSKATFPSASLTSSGAPTFSRIFRSIHRERFYKRGGEPFEAVRGEKRRLFQFVLCIHLSPASSTRMSSYALDGRQFKV